MTSNRIAWLTPADPPAAFPPVDRALVEPDGLLAAGGDLSVERLVAAYTRGIFPWYDSGQPILWWSPDPRCVLKPDACHLSRRFRRSLKNSTATVSFNRAFDRVIRACAAPRPDQPGTWITAEMIAAYTRLHDAGYAHSVEVWDNDQELVGGLYGVAIGRVFFAESMFSSASGGSKIALKALARLLSAEAFPIIDCQVASSHLLRLGAELMPRTAFVDCVVKNTQPAERFTGWPTALLEAKTLA